MKGSGAYWNVLKLRLNMALRREVVRNYPIAAYIEPTTFCNLRCPACPTGLDLGLRPKVAVDDELFKAALDEVGPYLFQLYMYNWGEPFLHKRTPELIRHAKSKEICVSLSSNLSLELSDEYIERIVRSGLDNLLVSLDGATEEVYATYRRRGDFERVRRNMRRLQEAKARLGSATPRIVWQFVVFRHNEHELEEVRRTYKEIGADEVSIISSYITAASRRVGIDSPTNPTYDMYHRDHPVRQEARRFEASGEPCSWLYGVLVLNPNGKISSCCAAPAEKDDFGEYRPGRFFEGWNSQTFRRARRLFRHGQPRSEPPPPDAPLQDLDGVASSAALLEDEVFCQRCPIPHLQSYVDPIVGRLAREQLRELAARRSMRALVNFLLMGAPVSRALIDERVGQPLRRAAWRLGQAKREAVWFVDNKRKTLLRRLGAGVNLDRG